MRKRERFKGDGPYGKRFDGWTGVEKSDDELIVSEEAGNLLYRISGVRLR